MALRAHVSHSDRSTAGKRRRLRSLNFLPTLITLGNLICGFAAIHFGMRAMYDFGAGVSTLPLPDLSFHVLERMLPSFLSVGAGLVLLGMVFDAFDGLIARVTRSTTNFGGQLDSLADIVTFGVAPASLMIVVMTIELAGESILPSPISENAIGRLTWVSAAFYVMFAAIRLARFNVEHAEVGADYKTFRGLPSPAAAAVMVSLVLVRDQPYAAAIRVQLAYVMPVIAFAVGVLMVSRLPYKRFGRSFLLGRQPFGTFVLVMLLIAVLWSYKAVTLGVAVLLYALSGPIVWAIRRRRTRGTTTTPSGESAKHASHRQA